MFSIITSRVTSAFPISVGTSLALESALVSNKPSIDPLRKIPQKINLTDYDEFWINISTLYRNLIGSLTKDDSRRVHPGEVANGLMQEMDVIKEIVAAATFDKVKVIFYICDYRDIDPRHYPNAILKLNSTENQKIYQALHDTSINQVLKERKNSNNIRTFHSELKTSEYRKAIIITHIAHDLLSFKNFKLLDLLESHTGVLKKKHQFNTKYQDGKKYSMMPFNKVFLQIFGDSEHFKPFPIKLRDTLIKMAETNHWTPATTDDKLRYGISTMLDHYSKTILLSMF